MEVLTPAKDAIVRIMQEGLEKPNGDQELPIDIHYQKLADWLVTRNKLPGDWHKRVQAIQAKLHESVKELDTAVFQQLPGGHDAPLDYFRAVQIRDQLASTSDRGLFGGLTGAAAVWNNIVKAYEKNLLFVGEAAQTMVQNADYEIPFLRKQAAKYNQQVVDLQRKQAEYLQSAASCAANFKQECKKLGVAGVNVRSELAALTDAIAPKFLELVELLRKEPIGEAMQYYAAFTQYAHGGDAMLSVLSEVRTATTAPLAGTASKSAAAPHTLEPSIDWDIGVGEAAETGVAPVDIVWDMGSVAVEGAGEAAPVDIDWDLGGTAVESGDASAPVDIDWDLGNVAATSADADGAEAPAPAAASASSAAINWDIDLSAISLDAAGSAAPEPAAPAVEISWDVTTDAEPSGSGAWARGADAGHQAASPNATQPGGSDVGDVAAARLVADAEYRSCLLDDLQELAQFLQVRRLELGSASTAFFMTVFPEALQAYDTSAVTAMQAAVTSALAVLRDERLRQLLLIDASPSYVDRLVRGLERRAGQEGKLVAASREMEARRLEAQRELVALQPRISQLLQRTRAAKEHTEGVLSGLFAGRAVNILGEINNVLANV